MSEQIERLQNVGFRFIDSEFEDDILTYKKYQYAFAWWHNHEYKGKTSDRYWIKRNKFLKEFMIENQINFKVSNKCCKYSKKDMSKLYIKKNNIDILVTGIRKSEGGQRASAYDSCYYDKKDRSENYSLYMPIFWYNMNVRTLYEKHYGVENSKCYTKYGFRRTGCACCPYGNKNVFDELNVIRKYESKLYKLVTSVFYDSYVYTRNYYRYRKKMETEIERVKRCEHNYNIVKAISSIDWSTIK